ncbi:hypothetical protein BU15DRAFT_47325 [Melanogaster broomeanus]|nr:hypothetical protein BU15DRAFT_47325 [Melanogaster broomeanus]
MTLQTLPVELLAEIFSELDLESLIKVAYLSRRLRAVASDPSLNPWRHPILRNLQNGSGTYEQCLSHLSVRSIVPRQNWIEIFTLASPRFLLFESTLPNLKSSEWEECFRRRFLPGWSKWKKDSSWKEAFMKVLYRVWHRNRSSCTSDESWTKYIVLNRSGSANELESSSRTFNPLAIFHAMKLQNNLAHLPTQIRLVLDLKDVRILALGVLDLPRTSLNVNPNAYTFLRPSGFGPSSISGRMSHPRPSPSHRNYPMFTPGGGDRRWSADDTEAEGMQWVGGLMYDSLYVMGHFFSNFPRGLPPELIDDIGNGQFASFTWQDFLAVAPWMEERISQIIHGQGLGIHL